MAHDHPNIARGLQDRPTVQHYGAGAFGERRAAIEESSVYKLKLSTIARLFAPLGRVLAPGLRQVLGRATSPRL